MNEIDFLIVLVIGGFLLIPWLVFPIIVRTGFDNICDEIKKK